VSTRTVPDRGLRVAELASLVGLSADSIRYYERIGLLPPPARTPAGYRTYDATAVDRLHFIQGAQRLGLHLSDIRELLSVRDTGVCACEPAEQLLRRRLTDLDAEVARLTTLRAQMVAMLAAIPNAECPQPEPGTWCLPEPEGGDDHASCDPVL
jgi:DNA-binding transcriptional MerR regulator